MLLAIFFCMQVCIYIFGMARMGPNIGIGLSIEHFGHRWYLYSETVNDLVSLRP